MKKPAWLVTITPLIVLTIGLNYYVYNSLFAESIIDWIAFFGGIFLVADAMHKLIISSKPLFPDQFTRIFRAIIGMCIFTIHVLQFMRQW